MVQPTNRAYAVHSLIASNLVPSLFFARGGEKDLVNILFRLFPCF